MAKNTKKKEYTRSEKTGVFLLVVLLFGLSVVVLGMADAVADQQKVINDVSDVSSGQWVCVQTQCAESRAAADDWIADNCREVEIEGEQQQMFCIIQGPDGQQQVPLSAVNTTNIRECTQSMCTQRVLVDNTTSEFEQHENFYFQE